MTTGDTKPIPMIYKNWRGETSIRYVVPQGPIFWGSTEWHQEPGWLFEAFDNEKQELRTFALKDAKFFDMEPHPDDVAVQIFAHRMTKKLAKSRKKGREGWDDPAACTPQYLAKLLHEHVKKGDPVDVANLAMMLGMRGESTAYPLSWRERLQKEYDDLVEKCEALDQFIADPDGVFQDMPEESQNLLKAQRMLMGAYLVLLRQRMAHSDTVEKN